MPEELSAQSVPSVRHVSSTALVGGYCFHIWEVIDANVIQIAVHTVDSPAFLIKLPFLCLIGVDIFVIGKGVDHYDLLSVL